jgi:hypothetical protein
MAVALVYNPYILAFLVVTFIGLFSTGSFKQYCYNVWYQLDVLAGSVFHFRRKRTVSGITGERAIKERYGALIMERVVNAIFKDDPDHCRRIYRLEQKIAEFEKTL